MSTHTVDIQMYQKLSVSLELSEKVQIYIPIVNLW